MQMLKWELMETYLGLMYSLIAIIILLCYRIQMALMESGLTLGKVGKQELMRLIQVHKHKDMYMYYSGMGYNSFYFMPDFNFNLPNFNFSFNSIPIFGW